jgi:hypothetical protein
MHLMEKTVIGMEDDCSEPMPTALFQAVVRARHGGRRGEADGRSLHAGGTSS